MTVIRLLILFSTLFWLVGGTFVLAQEAEPTAEAAAGSLTIDDLRGRIENLEKSTDTEDENRTLALDFYRSALSNQQSAISYADRATEYEQAVVKAPEQTAQVEAELEKESEPAPELISEELEQLPFSELQTRLTQERTELTSLQGSLADLRAERRSQQDRPNTLRAELTAAREELRNLESEASAGPPTGEAATVTEARQAALAARRAVRVNQIRMLEQEGLSYDLRLALLDARVALAARRVETAEERIAPLKVVVDERRQTDVDILLEDAQQAIEAVADKAPLLRDTAQRNIDLSEELSGLVASRTRAYAYQETHVKDLAVLEKRLATTKQQVELRGVGERLGRALLAESRNLPKLGRLERETDRRRTQLADARLQQFLLGEQADELGDPQSVAIERVAREVDPAIEPDERAQLESDLAGLLGTQHNLLARLSTEYARYANTLAEVDDVDRRYIERVVEYSELLNRNLFWIKTSPPLGPQAISRLQAAVVWLFTPDNWQQVVEDLGIAAKENLPLTVSLLVVFVALFAMRRRFRRWLDLIALRVGDVSRDGISLTLGALAITILLAAPWPLLLELAGGLLSFGGEHIDLDFAVGQALMWTGFYVFILEFIRRICQNGGLGEVHFRWPAKVRQGVWSEIRWFRIVAYAAVFIIVLTWVYPNELYRNTLGRMSFIVFVAAELIILRRLLRPGVGALSDVYRGRAPAAQKRLRYLWYPLAISAPALLAVLAILGYYITALTLQTSLGRTIWLVVGGVLLYSLLGRILTITERRLARKQAQSEAAQSSGDEHAPTVEQLDAAELHELTEQGRAGIRLVIAVYFVVGLIPIWNDVLPAIALMETVELWSSTVTVDGTAQTIAITAQDVMWALLTLFATFLAIRNIPSLVEILLLRRLNLLPGDRYAIRTVLRYVLITIGLITSLKLVGVSWSSAQWLVAALGVGIGFGLQEIVANFISGLLVLFERPIRVGDTVTVGDLTGWVSRIRVRATTVTDWDRKEIIIPNKQFITDRLINWTLSDPITRVTINVGVAYGSDPAKVSDVLREVGQRHPLVLTEPEPIILFSEFGDSSLNFELRVYVREFLDRLQVRNDLHQAIFEAFKENDITIPFPQRDLHVRYVDQAIPAERAALASPRSSAVGS